ncbi:uncharacterized protein Z518_10523 [Rhinocladiella mackenziei CBS 650.93]|uniref:ABC transporter domain-containing protein n=1 Tax=Rhinocladiella mackenziei CBS 650.93 TaxID=1442369 RepID=A0A0D2I3M4_9EURO|nr:uncharacterized protein Z518_10523 [Rhinocladiella mackenziei CBS 650.93]KIX00384.1 hypothetical protein Z518_10523 [Rhinocladiella mackenziei CBS 650.93]
MYVPCVAPLLWKQGKALLWKRSIILRRNLIPYLVAVSIPIIAAGCSTLFLRNSVVTSCDPNLETLASASGSSSTSPTDFRLIAGPQSQLSAAAIERISQAPSGAVTYVESLAEFNDRVTKQFQNLTPGGFFLGEEPTFAWRADGALTFGTLVQSIVDSMLLNVTIATDYQPLDIPFAADIGNLLIFAAYFGLSMAVYPAFFGLYPTIERLRGVRSIHHSNGVRALPLWSTYLVFDFSMVFTISVVVATIFGATTDAWYYLEYMFLLFLLYGIASTLISYIVSLFAKSQLAAFAIIAGIQSGMYVVFFVAFIVIVTYVDASSQSSALLTAYLALGIFSPVCNLSRAVYLTLNIFGVTCRGRNIASYPGAIDIYGAPILYLCLQSLLFFAILLWKDSGIPFLAYFRKQGADIKGGDTFELGAVTEFACGPGSRSDGLQIHRLRKRFRKRLAVDDVTFRVPRGECFALLGPNGDVAPSGRHSDIFVDGVSAIKHRAQARSKIGVCPQTEPLENMTVTEHLQFYALVRDISDPRHNVNAIIKAVGLEQYSDRQATKLSGGNKRKLSLGIALMGNPSVLLLDEPSSGMDVVSKRIMRRTLAAVTPGRSVVLTTHSMEEADVLATRAGILSGRMLALGSTEELKRTFGNVYVLQLVHPRVHDSSTEDFQRIGTWIQQYFPGARSEKGIYHGQAWFVIPGPKNGTEMSLAQMFEKMEMVKAHMGVQHYTVSRATLDQVFLAVLRRHNLEKEGD